MRRLPHLFVVLSTTLVCAVALAANDPPDASSISTNHLAGLDAQTKLGFVLWVTLAIIGFGLIVLAGITGVFWRNIAARTEAFVRLFAISLVVVASLVLIVAGYADSQIAPAFGLFGSIIGYLFGKADSNSATANRDQGQKEP